MRIRLKELIMMALSIFVFSHVIGQDIQLSQFYEADLIFNPAFAGRMHHNRIMTHHRMQYPNAAGKYYSGVLAYDAFIPKYQSGLGVYGLYDVQGSGQISSQEFGAMYAYELHFNKKLAFRAGMQAAFNTRTFKDIDLIYPDQITSNGILDQSEEGGYNIRVNNFDLSVGGLFFSENFWMGASVHHLNRPNYSFLKEQDDIWPLKTSVIAGFKIKLGKINYARFTGYQKPFFLFPMVHYKAQNKNDQLEVGLFGVDDQFKFGLWYRGIPLKKYEKGLHNNESVVVQLGWRLHYISFSYSYDFVVSKLTGANPRGAHEINISYIFFQERPAHKYYKKLPCPSFTM